MGSLVVAGGNIRDATIVTRFIELAGGPGAPIVVVPTALEGDVYNLARDYLEPLTDAGALNIGGCKRQQYGDQLNKCDNEARLGDQHVVLLLLLIVVNEDSICLKSAKIGGK